MTVTRNLLLLFLLTSLRAGWVTSQQYLESCDEQVKVCGQPLSNLQLEDESHVVPAYTVEEARQLCRTYDGVKACIKRFEHRCPDIERLFIQMGHLSYKYFCEDHFDEYVSHRDCLATPALHEEGKACNISFHISLGSDTYTMGTQQYRRDRLCPYIKTYLSCIYNLVESFCDSDAAEWQRGLDEVSIGPASRLIGCNLTDDGAERNLIIIAVIVTFGLVVLFILAGLLMWSYNRKKRSRERIERELGIPPRQPSAVYSVPSENGGQGMQNGAVHLNTMGADQNGFGLVPPPYSEKPPAYEEPTEGAVSLQDGATWSLANEEKTIPLPPYVPPEGEDDHTVVVPGPQGRNDLPNGAFGPPIPVENPHLPSHEEVKK